MRTLALGLPVLLAAALPAQATVVIPNGLAAVEGNSSTAYPWGRGTAQIRVQYVYDTTHFTQQGVTYPIVINRLRWRANGGAANAGGAYNTVQVQMSTCPVDQAAVSTTFASNHGPDLATVHNGPVTVLAGGGTTPNNWYVDIPLAPPFVYDPSLGGDLNIDLATDAAGWVGGAGAALDCQTTGANVSRMYNLTSYTSPTGSVQQNVGVTVEVGYVPASGLFPAFTATPTVGSSPLTVTFTDGSFTSDPAGILVWLWDFDNDTVIDSSLRNPVHTYTSCGRYSVALTVIDALHGSQTLVRSNLIDVDPLAADFTATPTIGALPLIVQFTDASSGPVTTWAWDFDNNGTIDSTLQNPTWAYGVAGVYNVRLVAGNACNSDTEIKNNLITVVGATTNPGSPEIAQFQFNEVRGQAVANTASTSILPATAVVSTANWQGDPGRVRFKGNEAGAGMLAGTNGLQNTNLVNCQAPVTITGSMTIAWWQRPSAPVSLATYPWGGTGTAGVRIFTGGVAGTAILYRGSTVGDVLATTNVQSNFGVWRHVALVIDDAAGTGTWYFDGVPEAPRTLAAAHSAVITEMHIGYHTSTGAAFPAFADMDDFRLYSRALSVAEIIGMIQAENPTTGPFGAGCAGTAGVPQISANGAPALGNAGFAVQLAGAENARLAGLVFGMAPRAFGTFDLGAILGPGCALQVDWFNASFHVTAGGMAAQAVPIPNNTALRGFHVYGQWLVAGSVGAASAALDINIQ